MLIRPDFTVNDCSLRLVFKVAARALRPNLHAITGTLRFLFFISLFLSVTVCRADFFCRKRDFAAADGLMQSHISNVQQDRNGFMWFATWNGLIRYDGYGFHTFKPILCSDNTIYSNRIYNIKNSSTGDMWCVSSDNRLFSFSSATCRFTDIQRRISCIDGKKVKVLTPLKNGYTWVTFKDYSCIRLSDADPLGRYRYFAAGSKSLKGSRRIYSICMDEEGNEWILTDRGAINVSKGQFVPGQFRHVHSIAGYTVLISRDGTLLRMTSRGSKERLMIAGKEKIDIRYVVCSGSHIVCAADNGIWTFNIRTRKSKHCNTAPAIFLFKDSRQRIWSFGDSNAVGLMTDVVTGTVKTLEAMPALPGELMKNPQLILEDNMHNIILKPCRGVLSYYDEDAQTLKECSFYNDSAKETYAPKDIKKFLIDRDNNLWVFHAGGADCISFSPAFFTHWENGAEQETRALMADAMGRYWVTDRTNAVRLLDRDMRPVGYMGRQGRIAKTYSAFSGMSMYCIKESPDHGVWIGTKGEGAYLLEPRDNSRTEYAVKHFRHDARDSHSLRSDSVYDIAFIGGKVFMASYGNGLSVGMKAKDGWRFDRIKNQPSGMKIRCIVDCGGGILLLGTADGLVTADMRNANRPKFYTNKYRNESWGLKGNDIMSIVRCGGHYYVCVFGSGISRIDSRNLLSDSLRFTNYIIPSVGTADQIKTAVVDGDCIWIMSEQSITCFSSRSGHHYTYTHDYFIGDFSFSEAQPVIRDGYVTVGTSDGLLSFSGNEIVQAADSRRIVVTGVQYQNETAMMPLNDMDRFVIRPEQRSFSLYLSSMEYGGRKDRRFRYMLQGHDSGWNYAPGNQPTVVYNSIPPGEYSLLIEATDDNGQWGKTSKTISIVVTPRFVETVWFRLILIILALTVVLGMAYAIGYFKRMRNIIQRKYSLLLTVDELSGGIRVKDNKPQAGEDEDKDRRFIEQSARFLNENLTNPDLVVEDFARCLGMSRTAYYNRMKQITGLSPVDFIKQMRIKKALELLDEGGLSIAEVAYRVGFSDPKYFSRCFKAEMNITPTQYMENRKSGQETI